VVETCVQADAAQPVDTVDEPVEDFTQSSTGRGSRPTRQWVFQALNGCFPFVYQTQTQPGHPEFPVNWKDLTHAPPLVRAVFVASKQPLNLLSLSPRLLDVQQRFDLPGYVAVLESLLAENRVMVEEKEQFCRRLHVVAGDLRNQLEEKEKLIQQLAQG
jgi:hypothetical protein